jgi:hypothetical protein
MAVAAGFAEFGVYRSLVVPGDAVATAAKILASERQFRLGYLGYLVAFLCDVPVALLLYELLRPVNKPLALTAAAFRLVYTALAAACLLHLVAAASLLDGGAYLSVLETAQRQALALLSLDQFKQGFGLALVFFGVHLLLLGTLLFKSRSFPKALGVLILLAGLAYLTDSLSRIVAPTLNAAMVPYLALPASLELVLALWLLVKGVR